VYRAEVAKVRPFVSLLVDATLEDGPWGADASGYDASRYAGPGFLLVGDAASFIDPLSSFGVKKALASAWVAAVATHTSISRPAMSDDALRFHDRRERAVVRAIGCRPRSSLQPPRPRAPIHSGTPAQLC
jgi:flavin-dependent dehydrogenase